MCFQKVATICRNVNIIILPFKRKRSEPLPQLLSVPAHVFVNASLSFTLICKHSILVSENENSDVSMIPVTCPPGRGWMKYTWLMPLKHRGLTCLVEEDQY